MSKKPSVLEQVRQRAASLEANRQAVDLNKAELERAIAAGLEAGEDTTALEQQYAALGAREAGLRVATGNVAASLKDAENDAMLERYEALMILDYEARAREAARNAKVRALREQINAIAAEQSKDNSEMQVPRGRRLMLYREGIQRGLAPLMNAINGRLDKQAREQAKQPENLPS